jgi:hypothetical protein
LLFKNSYKNSIGYRHKQLGSVHNITGSTGIYYRSFFLALKSYQYDLCIDNYDF